MRFRHVNAYPGTVEQVHDMLLDPGFREQVCLAIRAVEHDVHVDRDSMPAQVRISQTQAVRKIPVMAQRFVGDTVEIVQTESWTSTDTARIELQVPGKPGRLRGAIRLQEEAGRVRQEIDGELTVDVPLVGGRLEGLVAQLFTKALTAEQQVGISRLGRAD